MSINPKSTHDIIQEINRNIDSCSGDPDAKIVQIVRKGLNELSTMNMVNELDKLELISVASRIVNLTHKETALIYDPVRLFKRFVNRNLLATLSQGFLSKANITLDEAKEIEKILPKSSVEREEVLIASNHLINEKMSSVDKRLVLQQVATLLPLGERVEVCLSWGLIRSNYDPKNIGDQEFLSFIKTLPKSQREEIVSSARILVCGRFSQVCSISRLVAKLPSQEREGICLGVKKFLTYDFSLQDVEKHLNTVSAMPREKREEICSLSASLVRRISPACSGYNNFNVRLGVNSRQGNDANLKEVIAFVEECLKTDRKDVLNATSILKGRYSQKEFFSILSFIKQIPKEELAECCAAIEPLLNSKKLQVDLLSLLEVVKKQPSGKRLESCVAFSEFINRQNATSTHEVLYAIAGISSQDLDQVFTCAKPLIRPEMGEREIAAILWAIQKIPKQERDQIFTCAKTLIRPEMSGFEKASILQVIQEIPKEERDQVCACAEVVIEVAVSKDNVDKLLRAIQEIPKEERDQVCACAKVLIGSEIFRPHLVDILNSIRDIPKQEREQVCTYAKPLIDSAILKEKVSTVLKAIQELPLANRGKTCRCATCFIQKHSSDSEIISSLNALVEEMQHEENNLFFTCLEKVGGYRNKVIAGNLATILCGSKDSSAFKEAFLSLAANRIQGGASSAIPVAHKILPSIMPAKWIVQAREQRSLTVEEEGIIKKLASFLTESKDEFRNNLSPLMQTFLLTALSLDKIEEISPIRKLQLLSAVCNSSERSKGFGFIIPLCSRKETEALKSISLERPIEALKASFEVAITKDTLLDLSGIDNLADRYLEAFENTRVPMALETYMKGIRTLGGELVKKTLERFVRSILLGTFKEERYNTTISPHLARLQRSDTTILERWKTFAFKAPITPVTATQEKIVFSFEDFFNEKFAAGHGQKNGVESFSELVEFLRSDVDRRKEIQSAVRKSREEAKEKVENAPGDEKKTIRQTIRRNLIQELCMELIVNPELSKEDQLQKVTNLKSELSSSDLELCNDLKGLESSLSSPQRGSTSETVSFSAEWEDLFLAGSEVAGSCQRVDGQAHLN